jgi:hypothetical protein
MSNDLISHLESWRVSQGGGRGMGEPALEISPDQVHFVTMSNGDRRAFIRLDDLVAAVKAAQG